jgi:hypothetical protein
MVKKLMAIVTLALCVTVLVQAQEVKKDLKKAGAVQSKTRAVTMQGYVVDAMCAKGMAGKETTMKKAAGHTKDCALEKECAASGYGLFSEGTWYKFDAAGDKQAKEMIEKSSREKELAFEVSGTMSGDILAVTSLKETKLAKAEKKMEGKEEHKH